MEPAGPMSICVAYVGTRKCVRAKRCHCPKRSLVCLVPPRALKYPPHPQPLLAASRAVHAVT